MPAEAVLIVIAPLIAGVIIVAPWLIEEFFKRRRAGTGFTRRNRALTKVSGGGGGWRR